MTGVILRPADPADAPALSEVFGAARAQMTYLPVLHSPEEDTRFFAAVVDEARVEVAVGDGAVIGFAAVRAGWLEHLYVHPAAQRRGLGNRLIDWAQGASPEGLDLWVFAQNTGAQALYLARGWREVRRTDGHANEERLPDVHMRWTPPPRRPTPTEWSVRRTKGTGTSAPRGGHSAPGTPSA